MLSLLLIRAGATEYECQGRIQGALDIPLSEDGRQQILQVVDQVKDLAVEGIYVGPCQANQQSAEILAEQLHWKVKTVESLVNLDYGLWQGMLIDDVKTKQPKVYRQWQEHPETVCPPEGENISSVRVRLELVLAKLVKKHKSGTVAVVVDQLLARLLRNMLRDDALGSLWGVGGEDLPRWELFEVSAEAVSS